MSCAGQTERIAADFYATPFPAFSPLMAGSFLSREMSHYDPCCGDGRLIAWNRDDGLNADGADLYEPETPFRANLNFKTGVDFLQDTTDREAIETNPPYSLAQEFIHHGLRHSREMFYLLRISLLESDTRGKWWPEHRPNALFTLKKRPSFAMHCRCVTPKVKVSDERKLSDAVGCGHKWWLPIESVRPTNCPSCGSKAVSITTSDNAAYGWFYWGRRYQGFHWI